MLSRDRRKRSVCLTDCAKVSFGRVSLTIQRLTAYTDKESLRRFWAVTAAVALLVSFAEAPFGHTHRRDPDHQHASLIPHAHLRLLADQHPAVRGPDDDDVQPVNWVVLANASAQPFVAVASESELISPSTVEYQCLRPPEPQAHDPPGLISLPPRSPPV